MSRIAQVLRRTSDKALSHGEHRWSDNWKECYICLAIDGATDDDDEAVLVKRFLFGLGMGRGHMEFQEFNTHLVRQQVRHCWVLFAADLADEWGED